MIGAVGLGSGIGIRQTALLSIVILVCVLAHSAIAHAESEVALGSTESISLEVPNERAVGEPMTLTVEGTADGLHRLFVYGEARVGGGCQAWPYKMQTQQGAATLTSAEGEPLNAGHFSASFVVVPASEHYGVCAYLDTAPSANPDVAAYGCYGIPTHISRFPEVENVPNCLMGYTAWWVLESLENGAKEREQKAEAAEAQLRQREALEASERRAHEEIAATRAQEEAEAAAREEKQEAKGFAVADLVPYHCRVPALRRHTLAGVRHLLRRSAFRLGRVTTHHGPGTLVVKRQSPKRGTTSLCGSAVSIVLGSRSS